MDEEPSKLTPTGESTHFLQLSITFGPGYFIEIEKHEA